MPDKSPAQESASQWSHYQTAFYVTCKTVASFQYKIMFPFFPILAESIHTPITTFAWVTVAQQIGLVVTPYLLACSEVWELSSRTMQYTIWGIIILGNGLIALVPLFPVFLPARVLSSVAFSFSYSVITPILANNVPREHRERIISFAEISWALSSFLALPAGFLMQLVSWRAPFAVLAAAAACIALLVHVFSPSIPADEVASPSELDNFAVKSVSESVAPEGVLERSPTMRSPERIKSILLDDPNLTLYWCFWFFTTMWWGTFLTVGPIWLSDEYHFDAEELGMATVVTGCIELVADGLAIVFAPNYSKKSIGVLSVFMAVATVGVFCHIFFARQSLNFIFAMTYMNLFILCGEFAFVVSVSIVINFVSEASATMAVSVQVAVMGLGFGVSGFIGPVLYEISRMHHVIIFVGGCVVGGAFFFLMMLNRMRSATVGE